VKKGTVLLIKNLDEPQAMSRLRNEPRENLDQAQYVKLESKSPDKFLSMKR